MTLRTKTVIVGNRNIVGCWIDVLVCTHTGYKLWTEGHCGSLGDAYNEIAVKLEILYFNSL